MTVTVPAVGSTVAFTPGACAVGNPGLTGATSRPLRPDGSLAPIDLVSTGTGAANSPMTYPLLSGGAAPGIGHVLALSPSNSLVVSILAHLSDGTSVVIRNVPHVTVGTAGNASWSWPAQAVWPGANS